MTQNKSNRVRKTGKDVLPDNGDIPVVDHVQNPFENNTCLDLHYKDPEKNQHGTITVLTHQREKSNTYESNKWHRRQNNQLEDARDVGAYSLDPVEGQPFYQGFDVIVAGYQISHSELRIALEKLSDYYGKKFYYIRPDKDNPLDALPKIERLCDICGKRAPEQQLELVEKGELRELSKDKRVCSDKCKTTAQL